MSPFSPNHQSRLRFFDPTVRFLDCALPPSERPDAFKVESGELYGSAASHYITSRTQLIGTP